MKHQNSSILIIIYNTLTNIMSGKENNSTLANRVHTKLPTTVKTSHD